MTYEKMMTTIEELAKNQSFYGGLYQQITRIVSVDATYKEIFEDIARQFNDTADLVLYFEK